MKITVTAFLFTERNMKVNHGLKKSQGKRKKSQGRIVNGEFLKSSLFNYSLLITDYS